LGGKRGGIGKHGECVILKDGSGRAHTDGVWCRSKESILGKKVEKKLSNFCE